MYRHLLVPLDGSDLSLDTVSRAVNLARALGARVTFLHVHGHEALFLDSENSSREAPSPTDCADACQGHARALMTKAEAAARALGVPCDSTIRAGDMPHDVILDTAQKSGCDLIVMASHGRRATADMPLGSHTLEVLTKGALPVLVCSTRDIERTHPMVDAIRNEHRSLAMVLHTWLRLLDYCNRQGTAANVELMRDMAHYIAKFPLALDQPKEYDTLYLVLRRRTALVHAELDELDRQHERERIMADALGDMVDRYDQHQTTLMQLRGAVEAYARFMWEHMGRVEGVILPAAQRYLIEPDWKEIESATIRLNGAHADGESQRARQQLFSRIAHISAP